MATKTVKTVDVQILDAERKNAKTYKLDNPKEGLTRAEISTAFSPALTNSWLLAADGSIAMYLGDTILNTSIKVSLDGEDFYVTPDTLTLRGMTPSTVTVTGAQIQGYNVSNTVDIDPSNIIVQIAETKLTATVNLRTNGGTGTGGACSFNLELVIQGTTVTVPCTGTAG